MVLNTTRWDAAETLNTKDDVVAYLNAALEDGDPELLKLVLGDIARAKGPKSPRRRVLADRASTGRCRRTATRSSRPSPVSLRRSGSDLLLRVKA